MSKKSDIRRIERTIRVFAGSLIGAGVPHVWVIIKTVHLNDGNSYTQVETAGSDVCSSICWETAEKWVARFNQQGF